MDSFLAIITRSKKKFEGKLSLSCGDLAAIDSQYKVGTIEQRKCSKGSTLDLSLPRFLRPKSAGFSPTGSMDRTKSRSSNELVTDFDSQLAEIREKLAKFREQDVEFHERIDSLSHSIGELASRSSLNSFTPSEVSVASLSSDEYDSDSEEEEEGEPEEEQNYKDDHTIEKEIETISKSFLSDVLNSIPAIKVTCHQRKLSKRRKSSDPTEAVRLLKSSVATERPHSICSSPDYEYLCEESVSTLL